MAYFVLDGQIVAAPGPWGGDGTRGSAFMEPYKDPANCGLYIAPQGVSAAMVPVMDVVASGNYSVVGLPRRKRSRG